MVSELNKDDYESCTIEFDENNNALVTLVGKGKFAGKSVCNATRSEASVAEMCLADFAVDSWATIVKKVQSGKYPYKVGDKREIDLGALGEHVIRVSNTTTCEGLSVTSQSACGFVLEFEDIIKNYTMNENSKNVGGWPGSELYDYVNGTIYNAIPEDLRKGIITTKVISSHGITSGVNFTSDDILYLLLPQEIYGESFTESFDSSNGTSRQLDYYATYKGTGYTGVSTTNYEGAIKNYEGTAFDWWLRSAFSRARDPFYYVVSSGNFNYNSAMITFGVFPAFRIG